MNKELEIIKKLNVNDVSIKYTHNNGSTIKIINGIIEDSNYYNTDNYSVTLIKDEKEIKYNCTNKKDIIKLAETAINDIRFINNEDKSYLNSDTILSKNKKISCEINDIITSIIDNYNKLIIPKEIYMFSIYLSKGVNTTKIINSKNLKLSQTTSSYTISVSINAKKDNIDVEHFDYIVNNENIFEFFQNIIDECMKKFNVININSKKYNIIIKNKAISSLLSSILGGLLYESIDKKTSMFMDKLNKKIFSSKITLIEDPRGKNAIVKSYFDNEGTLTYKKIIIDKGVLKTYLYNNKMAFKTNRKSTGNSFKNILCNAYIKKGNINYEDLIIELNNGIIITKLHGLHAGINHTNGDFSLQAEGYYVNNGIKGSFIKSFIVSSNIFDLLNSVSLVSNDTEYNNISLNSPSILFKNITISCE